MNRKRHRYCHRLGIAYGTVSRLGSGGVGGGGFGGIGGGGIRRCLTSRYSRWSISRHIHLPAHARRYSRRTNSTRILSNFRVRFALGIRSRQSVRDAAQGATCNKRKRFNTELCTHKTHWPCASDWLTTMSVLCSARTRNVHHYVYGAIFAESVAVRAQI